MRRSVTHAATRRALGGSWRKHLELKFAVSGDAYVDRRNEMKDSGLVLRVLSSRDVGGSS